MKITDRAPTLPRYLTALALLGAACTGAACTGPGETGTPPTDQATPPHVDELRELPYAEELRIGSVDDPDVGFTWIGAVVHGTDGEVWVAETAEREIRVYDTEGALLRTIGREGEGPGEFESVSAFGLQGDTLWVRDRTLLRLTLFTSAGELLRTVSGLIEVPVELSNGRSTSVRVYPGSLRSDGLFESEVSSFISPNTTDPVVQVPRVLFDVSGSVVDTLGFVPTTVGRKALEIDLGTSIAFVYVDPPVPDTVVEIYRVDGDTVSVSWHVPSGPEDATFQIGRTSAGDTLFHHVFRYDPIPLTEALLDTLAASRARLSRNPADSARVHDAMRANMNRPPFHQPVFHTRFGQDGSAWIRLNDRSAEVQRWVVVGPDGELRGRIDLPPESNVRGRDGNVVWVAEEDEFDVPWLVKYRIGDPPLP